MAIVERPPRPRGITVIASHREWTCVSCGGTDDFLIKTTADAVCLDCADLGHLEFLPSGDAALTPARDKSQPTVRSRGAVEHATQSL